MFSLKLFLARDRLARFLSGLLLAAGAVCALAALDAGALRQQLADRFGPSRLPLLDNWLATIESAKPKKDDARLKLINDFINRHIVFDDDITVWQQSDYWATPLETLAAGAGDCEDFAIAKYATLLEAGVPGERLRLIYVRARIGGPHSTISQAHMVVGYYPEPSAEPLILDNLIGEIRPASRRADLFPIFSFTSAGLWVSGAERSSADPAARLSRWRSVLERMREEGFALHR